MMSTMNCGPDFVRVSMRVLVELKALLRATGLQVGLILNFGPKAQIKRIVFTRENEAPEKR